VTINKFMSAEAAVALIKDGDTVALIGGGGGLVEASCLHEAVEKRFLSSGHPRNLTVIHSLGIGDRSRHQLGELHQAVLCVRWHEPFCRGSSH